jgi:hypothetical protein
MVVAPLDDDSSLTSVSIPATVPTTIPAILCACAAEFTIFTVVVTTIAVAVTSYANSNAKILGAGYSRCGYREGHERREYKSSYFHLRAPSISLRHENNG